MSKRKPRKKTLRQTVHLSALKKHELRYFPEGFLLPALDSTDLLGRFIADGFSIFMGGGRRQVYRCDACHSSVELEDPVTAKQTKEGTLLVFHRGCSVIHEELERQKLGLENFRMELFSYGKSGFTSGEFGNLRDTFGDDPSTDSELRRLEWLFWEVFRDLGLTDLSLGTE